jgi:[acyl-carrier-protein] S-malonyltransferase
MTKKNILLFPGQGSQTVGMGKDIYDEFKEFRNIFEEASDTLGFNMAKLCFEDTESKLNLTEFTQPALLAVSTATFKTLQNHSDLVFDIVAGHSLGEYSALVSIGALNFADALKAVHFRGQAMQRAVPVGMGAMAAYLGTNGSEIPSLCEDISSEKQIVEVVNFNSPGQLVLSGHKEAVEKACQLISEKKLGRAKTLPVSAPFHSSLMEPAAREMSKFLNQISLNHFSKKIVANVDAKLHTNETYTKEILVKQIASPVLWTQSLSYMHATDPHAHYIEIGSGKVLNGLVTKSIEGAICTSTNNLDALKSLLK